MDLTVPRNVGYSGCTAWRKLRLDILEMLKKARPDLADKVHYTQKKGVVPS
jgi:hypothetical protein